MILHDHREIISKSDSNDEEMPPLEDASAGDTKYLVKGEHLWLDEH